MKISGRSISIARLNISLCLHLRPINAVTYRGSYFLRKGSLILRTASRLDAFSVYPIHRRLPGRATGVTTVLGTDPFKLPTPTTDRDQTVSRRFEPSSRTTLIGEQPNPWKVLPLQDVMSRHRGAKPRRRSELLDAISLLSPG